MKWMRSAKGTSSRLYFFPRDLSYAVLPSAPTAYLLIKKAACAGSHARMGWLLAIRRPIFDSVELLSVLISLPISRMAFSMSPFAWWSSTGDSYGITVLVVGKLSVTAVFTALMAGSPSLL